MCVIFRYSNFMFLISKVYNLHFTVAKPVAKIALFVTSHFYFLYSCFHDHFLSFNLKYIFSIHFYLS